MTTGSPDQIAMAKIQTPRKADGIAAALESQIIEGSRAPSVRLDERSLAEEFGVSRTPVCEAIRNLASMGLIENLGL